VFEGSITYLKKAGHTIAGSNKEAGQIATAIVALRNGKIDQVAYRVFLSFIKESATVTNVADRTGLPSAQTVRSLTL
jgi:hypothetical protein